ncbi:Gmad2 immunoglobulin-like domain-containing protein [Neolewinella litorea]|uniref:Bacterial spore germination immunoglobulin-like domain-containing protein n=1 Tax=Neolewinella litorea TaxID=2562452 RepID=A0A4V3XLC7_9BACT|nr:Gmad2 immunoglobulin-like domain-containing protein [Neolewinella litorea]THH40363.1 hypothetical protein E4021_06405 [Neolewinella litorea]
MTLRLLFFWSAVFLAAGCTDNANPDSETARKGYANPDYGLSLQLPEDWTAVENTRAPSGVVVSVFPLDRSGGLNLPLDIHGAGDLPYLTVWPGGLGTEPPAGRSITWGEAEGALPETGFAVNEERSTVFQLADGSPWGYLLFPAARPAGWGEGGFVFAQYRTDGLTVNCRGADGATKSTRGCDPLGGDVVSRTGTVNAASRNTINALLASLSLTEAAREPVEAMIRVTAPDPNIEVRSPLQFSGEARGSYYFEADFPVHLEGADGRLLATGLATAQSDWMTTDWVPFTGSLEFEAPDDERGYLVFERANPSGLEEHAHSYRFPVIFRPR